MEEQLSSKVYNFIDSEGNKNEHTIVESKLIFIGENGELLPECVYKPEEFNNLLNGVEEFDKGFVFFKTAEICDNNGNESSIKVISDGMSGLYINYNDCDDIVWFSRFEKYLEIHCFLSIGEFAQSGLGHSIMSLFKENFKKKIVLASTRKSINFYTKEGFIFNPEFNNGIDGYSWLGMEWTPKIDITPELREAVNNESRKLRKELTSK
jgi:hypothetical protein